MRVMNYTCLTGYERTFHSRHFILPRIEIPFQFASLLKPKVLDSCLHILAGYRVLEMGL